MITSRAISNGLRCMSTVGFIGLGNMGRHMAANLVSNGKDVVVFDVSSDAVNQLEGKGAKGAASPGEVAAQSNVLVTMVPSSPQVKEVYEGGVLANMKPGTLCIDSSTIDPSVSKSIAAQVKNAGGLFYDAPVSGGVVAAENGALTFMVGGSEEKFSEVKSYLDMMGANVIYCGDNGNGLVVKLCNNMMLGASMVAAAETLNLGIRMGMDSQLLSDILSKSTARCWSIDTYNPVPGVLPGVPSSRDYEGGFGAALMLKDLGLAQGMADASSTTTQMGSLAKKIYEELCEDNELAGKDFGVIFKDLSSK